MSRDNVRSLCRKSAGITLLALILIAASCATSSAATTPLSSSNTTHAGTTAQPTVSSSPSTNATLKMAQSSAGAATATTHPIEYHIGCPPAMVNDGSSLQYFKDHAFSTVHLVVSDQGTYQAELNKIKSFGMKAIIDVEIPIWNAGQKESTPIASFASYFQSLKNAGWEYVASEGGRQGDANYLAQYFKGYVNYNCDQCGLWKDMYKESGTVMNSWESYYTTEWSHIQQGAKEAAALGKQNGILAGVWGVGSDGKDYNPILTNSKNGGTPSYQSMLDWSYANGCGFTHFHVWCGDNAQGLSRYKALGFEDIVAQLQKKYPAKALSSAPTVSSWGPGHLDVFAKGTDGNLWHRSFQGGWSSWETLGKPSGTVTIASDPSAVSWGSGRIDVFVRGSDGQLWQLWYASGQGWHWNTLGTPSGVSLADNTAPAACSWGTNRLDIFVIGSDGQLWQKWWNGAAWQPWYTEKLGRPATATLQGSPGALSTTAWGYPRIDIIVRGSDGALYQKWFGGGWQPWHRFDDTAGTVADSHDDAFYAPTLVSWGKNRLDVFYVDTSGHLQQKYFDSSWKPLYQVGGSQYLSASPSAVYWTYGSTTRYDIFTRGDDLALWQKYFQYGRGWSSWINLGGITTA